MCKLQSGFWNDNGPGVKAAYGVEKCGSGISDLSQLVDETSGTRYAMPVAAFYEETAVAGYISPALVQF